MVKEEGPSRGLGPSAVLAVRFRVRLGNLALGLFCRRCVDEDDLLAGDEDGARPLRAQDIGAVAPEPAVEEVALPVRGERVELVAAEATDYGVCAPAAGHR